MTMVKMATFIFRKRKLNHLNDDADYNQDYDYDDADYLYDDGGDYARTPLL